LGQGERSAALAALGEAAEDARRWGAQAVARRAESLLGCELAAQALTGSTTGARLEMGAVITQRSEASDSREAPAPRAAHVRREGELWRLSLGNRSIMLKDSKGVGHLTRLLEAPGVELHVLDLDLDGALAPRTQRAADPDLNAPSRLNGTGEMLDEAARGAYRERLKDLRDQLEEAERFNDPERAARARDEIDFIGRELAAATGLGGRPRQTGDPCERARVNVTRALRRALGKIEAADPVVGYHLRTAVKTGTFCVYEPPPGDVARRPGRPHDGRAPAPRGVAATDERRAVDGV